MDDSREVVSNYPLQHEEQDSWTIHPSIDLILAKDKSRKARSDDPGWKYSWWPNVADKNSVQCVLCGHISRGGIKRLKEHLIGGYGDVSKCPKSTSKIREEMIKWKTRGMKRNPEGITIQPSDAGSNAVEVDEDVVPTQANKKTCNMDSGSGSTQTNAKVLVKKVGPLDILCQEDLVQFVADRRARKGKKQTVMEDHFKKQEKEMVDELCASFIYQCGLPFNIVNQQSFEVFCEGIGRYGRGYIPPSLHRIRKPLLEKHYENVAELKNRYLPHWKQYGVTLMTDGWTDRRGRSLLNFLVNCSEGTFFLNSVEASSEEKNADYLVGVIEEHMKLVGVENIIQICTDNASNYVLAGKKLMEKYQTIFWTP